MHHRGFFSTHLVDAHVGETFIIRSKRGTEWGTMISLCPADQESPPVHGRVLRRATADDLIKVQEIENTQRFDELRLCREKVEEHGLSMKLVDVEHLLGSEKIIFYFTANGRVDFRGLVKNLAQTLKTRIELKQIGVRDEARILGLVGHCGRSLCCRQYMREIEQVTMKMAKIQKSTLDPSKISGACGRLMCCLRYEDEVYRDLRKNSIPRGRRVWTEEEEVEVLDFQILSQKIFVQNIRGERRTIKLDEVLPPGVFPKKKEPVEAAPVRPRGERRPKPTGESPGPRGERRPKPTGESSGPRGERRPKPKGESPGPRGEQRPKPTGGSSTPPGEAPRRKKKKKRRRRRPGGQGGQADGNRSGSGGGGGSRPSQPRDSGGRSGGHGTPSPGKPGRPDRPSPGSDAGR
jgi:cell fate regulator YaaT (PSP1 superfamily)